MLKTYWDLTEKERAALSSTDVERFLDAELMTQGVLRVEPLALLTEPELPAPDTAIFLIRVDTYTRLDIAFTTAEAAQAAIASALHLTTAYIGSSSHPVVAPLEKAEVIAETVHSKAQAEAFRRDFEKVGEIREENRRRKNAFTEESTKEKDALQGLWKDWHECCARAERFSRVLATFETYLKMADGNDQIARKFLVKAYGDETLKDASEWHGRRLTWEPNGRDAEEMPAAEAVSP
jgi:hypothetical protein